jgi:hypothetical protein
VTSLTIVNRRDKPFFIKRSQVPSKQVRPLLEVLMNHHQSATPQQRRLSCGRETIAKPYGAVSVLSKTHLSPCNSQLLSHADFYPG